MKIPLINARPGRPDDLALDRESRDGAQEMIGLLNRSDRSFPVYEAALHGYCVDIPAKPEAARIPNAVTHELLLDLFGENVCRALSENPAEAFKVAEILVAPTHDRRTDSTVQDYIVHSFSVHGGEQSMTVAAPPAGGIEKIFSEAHGHLNVAVQDSTRREQIAKGLKAASLPQLV